MDLRTPIVVQTSSSYVVDAIYYNEAVTLFYVPTADSLFQIKKNWCCWDRMLYFHWISWYQIKMYKSVAPSISIKIYMERQTFVIFMFSNISQKVPVTLYREILTPCTSIQPIKIIIHIGINNIYKYNLY